MNILKYLGDFILSSWIWQFTADWFHPVITGITMFFFMRAVMRRRRGHAFLVSCATQLMSLCVLSLIAIGILVHMFGWEFAPVDPYEGVQKIAIFMPSMGLGLIYAIIQSGIFLFVSFFREINLLGFILLCWISNAFGAIFSYLLIHMSEAIKYQGG